MNLKRDIKDLRPNTWSLKWSKKTQTRTLHKTLLKLRILEMGIHFRETRS